MLGSLEMAASNHKVTPYTLPWPSDLSCKTWAVLSSTQGYGKAETHTKVSKGKTNSSLQGNGASTAAEQQVFSSSSLAPPQKFSFWVWFGGLFFFFSFWVSHASAWLCLFWGRTRQQPHKGFKYCHYMPQVGRSWLVGWKGSCLSWREGKRSCGQETGWLPQGPSRPLHKLFCSL